MTKKLIRTAFYDSLPVLAGYICLGIGFGVLLQGAGFNAAWAAVLSAVVYGGSMQYVAVGLLGGAASIATTAIMTLVIQSRHFFYEISMLEKYSDVGKAKPYLIFALTDETFSLVCRDLPMSREEYRQYATVLSIFDQIYWIVGSVTGALIGTLIPFDSTGIEFTMTSLFIVIFVGQWIENKNHIPALTGVGVTLLCLLIFGEQYFIIPSMIGIIAALLLMRPILEKGGEAR